MSKIRKTKIGLFATARPISPEKLTPFIEFIKKHNYELCFAENIFLQWHQFAGTDKERAEGFNRLSAKDIEVLWAVRGGYGTTRIIEELNLATLQNKKVILVGYSDLTALLIEAIKRGIPALHAPMPINFHNDFKQTEESFLKTLQYLQTEKLEYTFFSSQKEETFLETKIIGGNLSLLVHLLGTPTMEAINWEEFSLFVEDIEEYYYAIDRMFIQLKRSGVLERVQAVLVGDFTKTQDNEIPFGISVLEIIREKVPGKIVIDGFPVGHDKANFPLPLGKQVKIIRDNTGKVSVKL